MPTRPAARTARCAVHPARPAEDLCPACGRPRCGADARGRPGACRACAATGDLAAGSRRGALVMLQRAALAAFATCLLGGVISSEYAGTQVFNILVPLLVGVACGAAASAAAGRAVPARLDRVVLAVAGIYAAVGTMLGFRLVVGGGDPFGPAREVLPAYVAALAGPWVWRLVTGRRGPAQPVEGRGSDA